MVNQILKTALYFAPFTRMRRKTMTYREALRLIVGAEQEESITSFFCPIGACPEKCVGCWDREMPEPPKEEDHDNV